MRNKDNVLLCMFTASNWDCDANNHCCKGCGPQETFMGCSDISIGSSSSGSGFNPQVSGSGIGYNAQASGSSSNTNAQVVGIGAAAGSGHVAGFVPVGAGSGSSLCKATVTWKAKYAYADQWCQTQCPKGNCPPQYCQDSCRRRYR